jgi:putative transposase
MDLLDIKKMEDLKRSYRDWVEESLAGQSRKRESKWTESIAVGSKAFVEKTKAELGIKAIGREVRAADGVYELREGDVSYKPNSAGENSGLRPENTYFWNLSI